MRILTAAEARELDRLTIEELQLPGVILMEHAARAVAQAVREELEAAARRGTRLHEIEDAAPGRPRGDGVHPSRGPRDRGDPSRRRPRGGGDLPTPAAADIAAGTPAQLPHGSGAGQGELPSQGRVFVVAGGGNNGGDGYAAARLLHAAGVSTSLLAVVPLDELSGDAAANAQILARFGGPIEAFTPEGLASAAAGDVIVDALLGTGLSRAPEGLFAEAIEAIQQAASRGARVVAVDLPSGLDADSGRTLGAAVRADRTITFGALKPGLVIHPGAALAGEVEVASISWPHRAWERFEPALHLLEEAPIRALLSRRSADTHKGSFGHCLVVAGSFEKSGAAALAAAGAMRGGAGLVTVAARPAAIPQILAHGREQMAAPLPGDGLLSLGDLEPLLEAGRGKDALLIGPGIPRGEETGALLGRLLSALDPGCPVVLDADALNALAGQTALLVQAASPVVVTPHPGEMARLMGTTTPEVQADRIGAARSFAGAHRCTVVLKGAGTVIADPDGEAAVCPTGNPGMATAGSGDVLGGLLAALLAQGLEAGDAARAAVFVHGLAGDLQVMRRGQAGLVASDLLEGITEVWRRWKR